MKSIASIVVVAVAFSTGSVAAEQPAQVTYIANEGFLIEVGSNKVLIDAIFDDRSITYAHVPEESTLSLMRASQEPFDDVDLLLVTHSHRDHFSIAPVMEHLKTNPSGVLIGPPQVVDGLKNVEPEIENFGTRVRESDLGLFESEDFGVGDIRVRAVRFRHSAYMETNEATGEQFNRHEHVENLIYLVDVGGVTFLHVGDAVLSQNLEFFEDGGFPKQEVDIVFLEFFDWSEETFAVVERWMTPDQVVFMHLPPEPEQIRQIEARLQQIFPSVVVIAEPMTELTF